MKYETLASSMEHMLSTESAFLYQKICDNISKQLKHASIEQLIRQKYVTRNFKTGFDFTSTTNLQKELKRFFRLILALIDKRYPMYNEDTARFSRYPFVLHSGSFRLSIFCTSLFGVDLLHLDRNTRIPTSTNESLKRKYRKLRALNVYISLLNQWLVSEKFPLSLQIRTRYVSGISTTNSAGERVFTSHYIPTIEIISRPLPSPDDIMGFRLIYYVEEIIKVATTLARFTEITT